jgi:hypothetical protein
MTNTTHPFTLNLSSVRTVEASDRLAQRDGAAEPRPFNVVPRNTHPEVFLETVRTVEASDRLAQRDGAAALRPFNVVPRNTHPDVFQA